MAPRSHHPPTLRLNNPSETNYSGLAFCSDGCSPIWWWVTAGGSGVCVGVCVCVCVAVVCLDV